MSRSKIFGKKKQKQKTNYRYGTKNVLFGYFKLEFKKREATEFANASSELAFILQRS